MHGGVQFNSEMKDTKTGEVGVYAKIRVPGEAREPVHLYHIHGDTVAHLVNKVKLENPKTLGSYDRIALRVYAPEGSLVDDDGIALMAMNTRETPYTIDALKAEVAESPEISNACFCCYCPENHEGARWKRWGQRGHT